MLNPVRNRNNQLTNIFKGSSLKSFELVVTETVNFTRYVTGYIVIMCFIISKLTLRISFYWNGFKGKKESKGCIKNTCRGQHIPLLTFNYIKIYHTLHSSMTYITSFHNCLLLFCLKDFIYDLVWPEFAIHTYLYFNV